MEILEGVILEWKNNSNIVKEKKEAFGITVKPPLRGHPRGYWHVAEKLKFGRSIKVRNKITFIRNITLF